jgi:D-3-phosphoglycerate dehydrogenase
MRMAQKIITAGDRVYLKFFDLEFFHKKAEEGGAELFPFRGLDEAEFKDAIEDADALVVIDRPITESHIDRLRSCKIILALEVGYDFIDVEAATKKGIIVSNVPAYCSNQVAVHAVSLLLTVQRKIKILTEETRKGGWNYNICSPLFDLEGGVLGIIGLGKIGRRIVPKAKGFGMDVIAYDPYLHDDIFSLVGVHRCYELADLLRRADFITLHVPLTGETFHMIGGKEVEMMKKGAIVINTCRGKVIDEKALHEGLASGKLGGAGLDVLENEPPDKQNPLLNMNTAVVTPHAAWYSEESMERLKQQGMDEVVRVLRGKRPWYAVNPEVLYRKETHG